MATPNYMLRRTRKALEAHLKHLEHTVRRDNSLLKNEAFTFGGPHENSAWESAIQEEKLIDHQIAFAHTRLVNSIIIEDLHINTDTTGLGCIVTVRDQNSNEFRYVLVGPFEGGSRTASGLLVSIDAPLGHMLSGRRVGDEVTENFGALRTLLVTKVDLYVDDRPDDQLLGTSSTK